MTIMTCRCVIACMLVLATGCAKGDKGDRDATDVIPDPGTEPDVDAAEPPLDVPAEVSDPVIEVPEEVVEDGEEDAVEDPAAEEEDAPDDVDLDFWADITIEPGTDAPADPAPDSCAMITCSTEPPTDCGAMYPMGCCSSDRHTIYCIGGTTIYSGCGSGLCGPDPTRMCYMNCI